MPTIPVLCVLVLGLGLFLIVAGIIPPHPRPQDDVYKRLVCGANLKGLGTSVKIYFAEYEGISDNPFQTMLDAGEITPMQLICPSSGKTLTDVRADPYACYVLVPGMTQVMATGVGDDSEVVAYERDHHAGQGGNVLYADGHVEFVRPYSEVLRRVEESKRKLSEIESEPRDP